MEITATLRPPGRGRNLRLDLLRGIANFAIYLDNIPHNVMNWLTSDEELISIRPKEPEDRRLTVTGGALRAMFFVSVIGLPLFVILSGVSVWWKRR